MVSPLAEAVLRWCTGKTVSLENQQSTFTTQRHLTSSPQNVQDQYCHDFYNDYYDWMLQWPKFDVPYIPMQCRH